MAEKRQLFRGYILAEAEEGLEEVFTIIRFELSTAPRRYLETANIIDSSHGAIRTRTGR